MAKGKKTGGRRAGSLNRATAEARAACAALLDDPTYRTALAERLLSGKLAPAVECLLWAYAYGRPADRVEMTGSGEPITFRWQMNREPP